MSGALLGVDCFDFEPFLGVGVCELEDDFAAMAEALRVLTGMAGCRWEGRRDEGDDGGL